MSNAPKVIVVTYLKEEKNLSRNPNMYIIILLIRSEIYMGRADRGEGSNIYLLKRIVLIA